MELMKLVSEFESVLERGLGSELSSRYEWEWEWELVLVMFEMGLE